MHVVEGVVVVSVAVVVILHLKSLDIPIALPASQEEWPMPPWRSMSLWTDRWRWGKTDIDDTLCLKVTLGESASRAFAIGLIIVTWYEWVPTWLQDHLTPTVQLVLVFVLGALGTVFTVEALVKWLPALKRLVADPLGIVKTKLKSLLFSSMHVAAASVLLYVGGWLISLK